MHKHRTGPGHRPQPQKPSSLDTPGRAHPVGGLFANTDVSHPLLIHHTYFSITWVLLPISFLPTILLSTSLCSSHVTMSRKCPTDGLPRGRDSISAGDPVSYRPLFHLRLSPSLHLFRIRLVHTDPAHLHGQQTHKSQLATSSL